MSKFRFALNILAIAVFSLAVSSVAQAQATRTWVSGVGDDANPCSRTAPCKTFAGAISKTASSGEINVLDPGGFGAVTITKSITIDGHPFEGGVLVSGTNGIIVSAGASDKVILRGLDFNGVGTGINGIRFLSGTQLTVENCTIFGFTTNGIDINLGAAGLVFIKNTNITKCTTGVNVKSTSGFAIASLDHVHLDAMANGVIADQNALVTIRDSSIFQNNTNGVLVNAAGSAANLESTMVAHNGTGLNASVSGATIRISNVTVFGNSASISAAAGATVLSFFNCRIAGNGGGNAGPTNQQAQQ